MTYTWTNIRFVLLATLVVAALGGIATSAWAKDTSDSEEIEEIEEVEEIEVVDVVPAVQDGKENWGKSAGALSGTQVIRRIHPALVHFPIAWIFLLVLCELFVLFKKQPFEPTVTFVAALACLSTFPALLSGLLRADELAKLRPPTELVLDHRNVMFAVTASILAALVARVAWKKTDKKALSFVYYGIVLIACVLVLRGGHLGGQLVYGKEFLPF